MSISAPVVIPITYSTHV